MIREAVLTHGGHVSRYRATEFRNELLLEVYRLEYRREEPIWQRLEETGQRSKDPHLSLLAFCKRSKRKVPRDHHGADRNADEATTYRQRGSEQHHRCNRGQSIQCEERRPHSATLGRRVNTW